MKRGNKRGPIGLDIGASSIKMLQFAVHGGQPVVAASAYCELPREIPDNVDPAELIRRAISDALRTQPFTGREIVTAFGNGEFQMKNIRLPRMPPDELNAAVEFEAQERFNLGRTQAQIRHLPVGEVRHGTDMKEEVIVFAASEEAIAGRIQLLESLRLAPLAIDLAPCAVARAFVRFLRRTEDAHAINVFLDVGYRGTNVIITRGADVTFLKQIEVGGRHFNDSVAKALSIPTVEAADLRLRIMRDTGGRRAEDRGSVPEEIRAVVADALKPFVERLSRDLQLCLRYFAVTFRGQRPDALTLVGGEAHEPLLTTLFSESVNIPCIIGHPLRGIGRLGAIVGRDRRTMQPAWATACGLALRGSDWVRTGPRLTDRSAGPSVPSSVSAV